MHIDVAGIGASHEGEEVDGPLPDGEDPWCSGDESGGGSDADEGGDGLKAAVDGEDTACKRECEGEQGEAPAATRSTAGDGKGAAYDVVDGVVEVSSSYRAGTTDDVEVLNLIARQAATLADPSLLWVVLKRREHVMRRLSHEQGAAAKSCADVLNRDADQTNQLRRNAIIEDKAKSTEKALDKLFKRKRCSRRDPPAQLPSSRPLLFVSAALPQCQPLPISSAVPQTGGQKAVPLTGDQHAASKSTRGVTGWRAMPHKYKKKYKAMKKSIKSSGKLINKFAERVKAFTKANKKPSNKLEVVAPAGLPKATRVPKEAPKLCEAPNDATKPAVKPVVVSVPKLFYKPNEMPKNSTTPAAKAIAAKRPYWKMPAKPTDGQKAVPETVGQKAAPQTDTWVCHSLARNPLNPSERKMCSTTNPKGKNFCHGCGIDTRMVIPCRTCGNTQTRVTASRCVGCGQRVYALWPPLPAIAP